MHRRMVYNCINLAEDIGGIVQSLSVIFSVFLLPISAFSFNLRAIKNLFLVRTSESNLLKQAGDRKSEDRSHLYKDFGV